MKHVFTTSPTPPLHQPHQMHWHFGEKRLHQNGLVRSFLDPHGWPQKRHFDFTNLPLREEGRHHPTLKGRWWWKTGPDSVRCAMRPSQRSSPISRAVVARARGWCWSGAGSMSAVMVTTRIRRCSPRVPRSSSLWPSARRTSARAVVGRNRRSTARRSWLHRELSARTVRRPRRITLSAQRGGAR